MGQMWSLHGGLPRHQSFCDLMQAMLLLDLQSGTPAVPLSIHTDQWDEQFFLHNILDNQALLDMSVPM